MMSGRSLNRAELRKLLETTLRSAQDLDAFCIDHFPDVYKRFDTGMDRVSKLNLLLVLAENHEVLQHLDEKQRIRASSTLLEQREQELADNLATLYLERDILRKHNAATVDIDGQLAQAKAKLRHGPGLNPGEVLLERYQLVESLGRGLFAEVWLAHDLKISSTERDHTLAIKVLHGMWSRERNRVARFEQGAHKMLELTHPRIVRLLGKPAVHEGFHFFPLEYLAGGDLAAAVRRNPQNHETWIRAVFYVGEALTHAHRRGCIHRDVKPQNILLDERGDARLADFDLILVDNIGRQTMTNVSLGTPAYAAPEQLRNAAHVDERADEFALAMTTIYALTGQEIPVTERALMLPSVLRGIAYGEELNTVLAKALSDAPSDRFPDVARFCGALKVAWENRTKEAKPQARVDAEPSSLAMNSRPLSVARDREQAAPSVREPDETPTHVSQVLPPSAQSPSLAELPREIGGANTHLARRFIPVVIAVGALVTVFGGLWLRPSLSRSDNPEDSAGRLLIDAEIDLRAKHWSDAAEKSGRILGLSGAGSAVKELAQDVKLRAEVEAKSKQIYERFATGAGSGNYDQALTAYREISDDSVYRQIAREQYDQIFPLFVENHLKAAEVARGQGKCEDFRSNLNAILAMDPNHAKALAAKERSCGGKEERVAENPPDKPEKPERVKEPRTPRKPKEEGGTKPETSRPDKLKEEGDTKPETSPPDKPPPAENAADVDTKLSEAQTEYVNGNYSKAIEMAKSVQKGSPVRAWRIIGSSACNIKDVNLVNDSYRRLDAPGRQYLVYVCQRNGVSENKGVFRGTD